MTSRERKRLAGVYVCCQEAELGAKGRVYLYIYQRLRSFLEGSHGKESRDVSDCITAPYIAA